MYFALMFRVSNLSNFLIKSLSLPELSIILKRFAIDDMNSVACFGYMCTTASGSLFPTSVMSASSEPGRVLGRGTVALMLVASRASS